MAQNIYDDPTFFDNYAQLNRSRLGLDGAPEWPALRAMLPPLAGLRVADLGCGYGWFCRWAAQHGAAEVLGLDLSERMLAQAEAATGEPNVRYRRADLEQLDLPSGSVDLACSSLAFHYVQDLATLLARLHRALVPGGQLVFSTEHPILTAPRRHGFRVDADGWRFWPIDGYQDEGARVTDWLENRVIKQHRTLGTLVNTLIEAGFTLDRLDEWGPTPEQLEARPELADERERPLFVLVAATRRERRKPR